MELHFSTLARGESEQDGIERVGGLMARQLTMYINQLGQSSMNDEVRANAARVVRRVLRDFDEHFFGPEVEVLKAEGEKVLALLATRSLEDAGDVRTHLD
jgi:hypothetical protein